FLIPGVVSPSPPSGFSFPAAYGDLLALAVRYQARCAFLLFMSCQLILSSASVSRGVHLKQEPPSTGTFITKSKYAIFDALNPFFEIVQEGLTGLVDGKHFFDTIADDAFLEVLQLCRSALISLADMVLEPSVAGLFKWRQFEPE